MLSTISMFGLKRTYLKILNLYSCLLILQHLCLELSAVKMVLKDPMQNGRMLMASDGLVKTQYQVSGLMLMLGTLKNLKNVLIR